MEFKGKRIIITGAGRGLGAAFAVTLADQGAEVVLAGRNRERLTALAESIRLRTGTRPEMQLLDMADPSAVTGTLLLTRGLIPLLEKSGAGDIMTIVSVAGLPNARLQQASVAFAASKQAQAAISEGLRQELKGRPLRVQAIFPPVLDDISPLDAAAWAAERGPQSAATTRDIVETVLFALSRPRHVSLASIVVDSATGGIYESGHIA